MDLAKILIRSVVRAFYDTKHVLVIDALMVHSAYARYICLECGTRADIAMQVAQRGSGFTAGYATERPTQVVWKVERG